MVSEREGIFVLRDICFNFLIRHPLGCWVIDLRLEFAPQGLVFNSPLMIYLGHVRVGCLCALGD